MNSLDWTKLQRPLVCLAPMDGYTDSAYRRVCKEVNQNIIVFTEFTSADGLQHTAKKLQEKLRHDPDEKPIIAQIFGKNPDAFAEAARYCEQQGFDGVDLNMGCPARKVVKSEHGVALRKKPDLAFQLIETVVKATSLPVSVKTRLGWSSADDLLAFARGVESAGAALITVHGRTYNQGFSDQSDWHPIYELKKQLCIPVIGNGDVKNISDGKAKHGNLDGFMIGRASMGNPWVFSEQPVPAFKDKIPLILKHAQWLVELKGERIALLEIRKHLLAYVKGLPNASQYRSHLVRVKSINAIRDILNGITASIT
ncbi:MAG: tRNA-dihydrouridine synthase family protein [Patescibacteria group bacterium]